MNEPFYIQWHITNLCNLRCSHCYQDDFSKKDDLDWPGLKPVCDNLLGALASWGRTACVHLTGGEPLLKPELFSLLHYLNPHPLVEEMGLITNGLPLDREMLHRLSAFSKVKKIKISLEGADAQVHESVRPRETFDRVIEHLSLAQKDKRFETTVMFTVMKRNYKSLPPLLNLCQAIGVHGLILERFIPWGRGAGIREEVLSREEWKAVAESLLRFLSMENVENMSLPYQAFQMKLDGEEPELLGAPCVAGVDGLCVMPGGDVFPCRRFPVSLGNLRSQSLKELWKSSDILERLRKKENLSGKCGRCGFEECRGCRSLALSLTGDYLAEDPHCWSFPG